VPGLLVADPDAHRALDIGAVLGQAVNEGHGLGFGSFTMRHHRSQALRGLWTAASKAWGRATSGGAWVTIQDAHGVIGWVRVWEVTDGRNGWHVHVHFVVVLAPGTTADDLDAVGESMFDRWSKGLVAAGLEAPRLVGQDWHLVTGDQAAGQLAEYLFKLVDQADVRRASEAAAARSLGMELAHTSSGRARADLATKPVWHLVESVATTGDLSTVPRWHEWEQGSKGRRQVGWSKGLRARFRPAVDEASDEAIVDQELGTAADDVAVIDRDGWSQLVRIRNGCTDVLDALERGGVEAMRAVLDGFGIGYQLVVR
jgi:hypothetical protein